MTNAIVRVRVSASANEGDPEVPTSKPAAEQLREILEGEENKPFEGSGCSDHVRRRNLRMTIVGALILLAVLIALLVF